MRENQKLSSFGKYHLIASLGQGGMAKVYLALVAGPGGFHKLLVVKVLQHGRLAEPEEGLQLFWDEARLAARLVHPNIVHTYEVGEIEGLHFLAMEYLDGKTYRELKTRASARGLPLHEELRIIGEVARGLHYAHELTGYQGAPLGVIHRDVSPQNVFVTYDGQVKLIDFGIAKTHDADHETRTGVIKGKLDYIAPEQLNGESHDRRVDVFALGVLLWEAIAGKRFAGGPNVADVAKIHARLSGREPNIRTVKPEVAEPLAEIVDRALALDPNGRWADAASFADALDRYLESNGHKPSAKSLAEIVKPLFAQERLATEKLIEGKVQALASGSVELITPSDISGLGGQARQFSASWSRRESDVDGALPPAKGPRPSIGAVSDALFALTRMPPARLSAGVLAAVATVGAGLWLFPLPSEKPVPPAPAPLAAAAATNHARLEHKPPPWPARASAVQERTGMVRAAAHPDRRERAPVPSPQSPAPERATMVRLELKVAPRDARVSIDGMPVAAPFVGAVVRDPGFHTVEASARGHRPYQRLMTFDRDQRVTIALEPLAQTQRRSSSARAAVASAPEARPLEPRPAEVAAPVAAPPPAAQTVTPGADIVLAKSRLRRHQIDTADPYRQ